MKAEKILKLHKLEVLLIPVPRQLSSDCGLAIRFPLALRTDVEQRLSDAGLMVAEIWYKEAGSLLQLL